MDAVYIQSRKLQAFQNVKNIINTYRRNTFRRYNALFIIQYVNPIDRTSVRTLLVLGKGLSAGL